MHSKLCLFILSISLASAQWKLPGIKSDLTDKTEKKFRRFKLRCLYVGSQTITLDRQQITLPSTEDQLQEFFSKILISQRLSPNH